MKKDIGFIFLFLVSFIVKAQNEILSVSQAKEDIEIFVNALKEIHPGLDIHLKPSQIDSVFEALNSKQEKYELQKFYTTLLQAVAAFQDGHTDLSEGKRFRSLHPYLEHTLPFEFLIIGDKIYISKNYTAKSEIPLFSEVLAVNEEAVEQILARLYELTPADAGNRGFKERYNEKILGRQFSKLIEFSDVYTIEVKKADGSIGSYKVKGIKDEIIHANHYDKIPLSFEVNKSENFALLTVNTFQYRLMMESGIDFHKFIEKSFKELRNSKVENLILDLRENYGGDNILAITLYSYLTQGTFQAMLPSLTKLKGKNSVSPYSNFPEGNYPFLNTHDVTPLKDGFFEVKNGIDSKESYHSDYIYKGLKTKPQNIAKHKFNGHIYCLTSGLTFSAAANLTTLLNRNKQVLFLGQETGGANGYFCGGGFYTVTLPHSQFVLQIPYMKRCVMGAISHTSGVLPDYPIERSIEKLQKKEDAEMQKVKELIKK